MRQENVQSLYHVTQLFFYTLAVTLPKKRKKSLENLFSSFGNAILSIILKNQKTDVKIQTFSDKDRNIPHSCFF